MFQAKVLDKIPIFKRSKAPKRFPKHIAITVEDNYLWKKKNKKTPEETFVRRDLVINDIIGCQVRMNIPIITLFLLPEGRSNQAEEESLVSFFENLIRPYVHENQIKISVLGKWYGLSGKLVEEIKHCIDETKTYDRFFLNFCVNYDGQSEIVDACKLIARKIKADSIEIAQINKELIKDNLYSSYFLSPDLIIKTGMKKRWSNLLLWDSASAHYYFADKVFNDLSSSDIEKAIEEFRK